MGKGKKLIGWAAAALLLAALFLWRFLLPRFETARLENWLNGEFGYSLQTEETDFSFFGNVRTLKKVLLVDRNIIEHPVLSAEEIRYTRPFSKMIWVEPKIILTLGNRPAVGRLINFLQALQEKVRRIDLKKGELEIWRQKAFVGFPLRLTDLDFSGALGPPLDGTLSFSLPAGLSSLRELASGSKTLPDKKLDISTEVEFFSWNRWALKNIQVSNTEGAGLSAGRLEWNVRLPEAELLLENADFALERTHTGRWRLAGTPLNSLWLVFNQLAELGNWPSPEFELKGGSVLFSDKQVFPLFAANLQSLRLKIEPSTEGWVWQSELTLAKTGGFIQLEGIVPAASQTSSVKASFRDLPSVLFFPYYYRQIPFEKLEGTFSGAYADGTLRLVLKGPWGAPQPGRDDKIMDQTGIPASRWLELLQNQKGEVELEIPFAWNWDFPLAKTLLARQAAPPPTVISVEAAPKIWKIKRDSKGFRYLEEAEKK